MYRKFFFDYLFTRFVQRVTKSKRFNNNFRLVKLITLSYYWIFLWFLPSREKKQDLICVVSPTGTGWILEAICREIVGHWPAAAKISYETSSQPPARTYFLCHYSLIKRLFLSWPKLFQDQVFVFYTHARDLGMSDQALVFWLSQTTKVIAMNSRARDDLIAKGLAPEKVTYALGGANPTVFTGHQRRSDGLVGFCTAFYERKSPDRILQIVKAMPQRSFLLVGHGWEGYPRFGELTACPNFEYVSVSYEAYPALYKRMTVFVSPALLEGGPIPLIEAMMENVVPVASDTGFARDIIEHGRNGYIFHTEADVSPICELIECAFENRQDIRETVKHLTWERFARQIHALR